MALGARNRADAANRPKPVPTKLDKLKEILKEQYVVHKAAPQAPAPQTVPGEPKPGSN